MTPTELKYEKVYIKDIYQSFKGSYFPNQFDTKKPTRGRSKLPVPLQVYKKIIYKYMEVYFNEVYFGNVPQMYFFLSGKMQLARTSPKRSNNLKSFVTDFTINLFWSQRPHYSLWGCVKLKKLGGSSNIIPKLDKRFALIHDLLLLPKLSQLVTDARTKKTLFRQ